MDFIWRLLVAIFIIVIGAVALLIAEVFGNGGFATFCFYVFLVLVPAGIIKGIVVMVDYHIAKKHQDDE